MSLDEERKILISALEEAVKFDKEHFRGRGLLSTPDKAVLQKVRDAIEACTSYKDIAGHAVYTGGSAPVLTSDLLASSLFNKVNYAIVPDIPAAADWLLKLLDTRQAAGLFKVAVWGVSVDAETTLPDSSRLVPWDSLPKTYMKTRTDERARESHDGAVWRAYNFFDKPTAAHVIALHDFPYIGGVEEAFSRIAEAESIARNFWLFIQAALVGHPLAIACWFEYQDDSLDFNDWQNSLAWILPEVHPRVEKVTRVTEAPIKEKMERFEALPMEARDQLLRSMGRFELSQCRTTLVDCILELELAFEIALSGPGPEAAVSWKVSVRCAQLIGGPVAVRQIIRERINKLYRLRSKATHGSDLSTGALADLKKILVECTSIYQQLILSLLALGKEPEWGVIELEARIHE
jgi:hypothetical protein